MKCSNLGCSVPDRIMTHLWSRQKESHYTFIMNFLKYQVALISQFFKYNTWPQFFPNKYGKDECYLRN